MAEKSSPGTRQADGKKLGLVWRNREKISQNINAYPILTVLPLNYFMVHIHIRLWWVDLGVDRGHKFLK
jgi:hypothetical protein